MNAAAPSAALLIIGNEILSGRTQDANLNYIARKLGAIGIPLKEARVVPDVQSEIVAAVNALRVKYTYLFTTGGIGPTHDDITVDAVAAAFSVAACEHPEARDLLLKHYGLENATPARMRMARTPVGATLVANPVSVAPGIRMDNVYLMAGVPNIMQSMMDNIAATLRHGPAMHSMTVTGFIPESAIAEELGAVALKFPQLDIGSYPWVRQNQHGTSLVARGTDDVAVKQAAQEIYEFVKARGVEVTLSVA